MAEEDDWPIERKEAQDLIEENSSDIIDNQQLYEDQLNLIQRAYPQIKLQ